MSTGRKSYEEQTRVRLLDLWRGEADFGRPIGCVATTFTFDPAVFEEQCLARFLRLHSNPNETPRVYLLEREEKLAQTFACVLVDDQHVVPDRSLRWNLLPVRLPSGGVQHAKLAMLVWEHCIRVLIGSANLTEPAYRKNQEHVATLDFLPEGELPHELLRQVIRYINRLREFCPGVSRTEGPQAVLSDFLRSVEGRLAEWKGPRATTSEVDCALIPLLPDTTRRRRSVLDQLGDLWRGPAPDQAWVLSPFFDKDDEAAETAAQLAALLSTKGPRSTLFLGSGRELPDGVTELEIPNVLRTSSHRSLTHHFGYVADTVDVDGEQIFRPLHAKSIWLQRAGRAIYMIGSSNFTKAGLGLHKHHNAELNLAYRISDTNGPFAKMCDSAYPEFTVIEDPRDVQFLAGEQLSEQSTLDADVLPTAFGLALFKTAGEREFLELEIADDVPKTFSVLSSSEQLVIDSHAWEKQGRPRNVTVPWTEKRPPSGLSVKWTDNHGLEHSATWVVNVADAATLPPPAELQTLTLEELLEILSSTRPLFETIARILDRREGGSSGVKPLAIDPHAKVDTRNYLLRRMRRVGDALEGLKERLEEPLHSLETLRWRLWGPVGPVALAKRLANDEKEGGAFMVAEVAMTLRDVRWRGDGFLASEAVHVEVTKVIGELRGLVELDKTPDNLARYVEATFEELLA